MFYHITLYSGTPKNAVQNKNSNYLHLTKVIIQSIQLRPDMHICDTTESCIKSESDQKDSQKC